MIRTHGPSSYQFVVGNCVSPRDIRDSGSNISKGAKGFLGVWQILRMPLFFSNFADDCG